MSNEQCPPSVRQFYPAKLLECLCALQEDGNATLIRPERREKMVAARESVRDHKRERGMPAKTKFLGKGDEVIPFATFQQLDVLRGSHHNFKVST